MQAPTHIEKPKYWQVFESLCKELWGSFWECADTIKKNGRPGQNQHGIDILGIKKGEKLYSGIQCKCKDQNANAKLTQKEIDAEITKALHYKDELIRLIIATTANKDAEIEDYVRRKNLEHLNQNLFEVHLFAWEDIEESLMKQQDVYQWYINNAGFITQHHVSITFEGGKTQYIIKPHYIRMHTRYVLPDDKQYLKHRQAEQNARDLANKLRPSKIQEFVHSEKTTTDQTWCKVPICIKNIGVTDVEVEKIRIDCKEENVLAVNTHIPTELDGFMSAWGAAPPELVTCSDYAYGLVYQPRKGLIVSKDSKHLEFYIQPREKRSQLTISFEVFAKNGVHCEETLNITVEPEYHPRVNYVEVTTPEQTKEEIEILHYYE